MLLELLLHAKGLCCLATLSHFCVVDYVSTIGPPSVHVLLGCLNICWAFVYGALFVVLPYPDHLPTLLLLYSTRTLVLHCFVLMLGLHWCLNLSLLYVL